MSNGKLPIELYKSSDCPYRKKTADDDKYLMFAFWGIIGVPAILAVVSVFVFIALIFF